VRIAPTDGGPLGRDGYELDFDDGSPKTRGNPFCLPSGKALQRVPVEVAKIRSSLFQRPEHGGLKYREPADESNG